MPCVVLSLGQCAAGHFAAKKNEKIQSKKAIGNMGAADGPVDFGTGGVTDVYRQILGQLYGRFR